jgi:hypothetical protein
MRTIRQARWAHDRPIKTLALTSSSTSLCSLYKFPTKSCRATLSKMKETDASMPADMASPVKPLSALRVARIGFNCILTQSVCLH